MEIRNKDGLTEREFLKNYKSYDYERPSVTTDLLIFTIENIKNPILKVLLIKREDHPYIDCWALPGGFVCINESIDDAAKRKLEEETGFNNIYLEQLYTFGNPDRDPRMRVITTAYMALIPEDSSKLKTSKSHIEAKWFNVILQSNKDKKELVISNKDAEIEMIYEISETKVKNGVIGSTKQSVHLNNDAKSKLAFDHAEVIYMAINRIAGKCEYVPILYNLMPNTFTIPQLQSVYELFLMRRPHNTLFRKKIASYIEETGLIDKSTNRPAKLYKYKQN